jgi:triphosphoribosyl-dephospho-CoA synthase
MKISFDLGYRTLMNVYEKTGDINIVTVHTFLTILAKHPDTFIARKVGLKQTKDIVRAVKIGLIEAKKVSRRAERVLKLGGMTSEAGRRALNQFDMDLRDPSSRLNPGTTADITASSLMIAILCGMRP